MNCRSKIVATLRVCVVMISLLGISQLNAATDVTQELQSLRKENQALKKQVQKQDAVIESLSVKVANIEAAEAKHAQAVADLKADRQETSAMSEMSPAFNLGKVHISGEGGVAFFHSDKDGNSPNAEFRIDEAKLFLEAPIWGDVYFYSELNLATREKDSLELYLGEVYLDIEDVSKLWGCERMANIRVGRFDIPFGEEYIYRDAIDNPLISHSLADMWGVDEGVEFYGTIGKFSYVLAVQNGGISGTRDFNADKAVVGRVSFDPTHWLHLSVSGMRTGDLDAKKDYLSEMWFGNGWFRSLGSTNTTLFNANLVEGDIVIRLPRGLIRAFGGYIAYDDNDPKANNCRDVFYYSIEGVADITRKFYAGARFSQIFADKGFPIVGDGNYNEYFYHDLTEDIWRLSLGAGYRFNRNLVVKAEYTLEQGNTIGGGNRHGNMFAAEAAFGF